MSTIEFYSGVDDPPRYVLRLLRKAHAKGARVAVVGDGRLLRKLDADLWTADTQDFVPHIYVDAASDRLPPRLARTPLWLVENAARAQRCDVLVNLGPEAVEDLDGFRRVLEVVGADAEGRQSGRARWRHYEARGHSIEHHAIDASARGENDASAAHPAESRRATP